MSMTALVSAFARAYHTRHEGAKIFDDKHVRRLLSDEEYQQIGAHMVDGVSFFDPAFRGDAGDALSGCIGRMARSCGLRLALYLTPQDTGAVLRPLQRRSRGLPHVRARRCGLLCADEGIRWKVQGKRPAFSYVLTALSRRP